VADNTKCFTGSSSLFGSEYFSKDCSETYIIDFPEIKKTLEHILVHEIYRQILKKNTLYKNILSLKNTKYIPSGRMNVDKIAGKYLLTDLKIKGENKEVVYGSEVDNEFSCSKTTCIFAGWYGKDKYIKPLVD
jgi:hypothetical protein